jgi:hypothetical protein
VIRFLCVNCGGTGDNRIRLPFIIECNHRHDVPLEVRDLPYWLTKPHSCSAVAKSLTGFRLSARISQTQANSRQHRIRGHFSAGFPDAPSSLRPGPKVNIAALGAIPIFFRFHRHCYAPAYGEPGMDLLQPENILPHRTARNGDLLQLPRTHPQKFGR